MGNARTSRVADECLDLPQAILSRRIPKLELDGDGLSSPRDEDEDAERCRGRFVVALASARERDALRLFCVGGNGRTTNRGELGERKALR